MSRTRDLQREIHEVEADLYHLSDEDLEDKYGATRDQLEQYCANLSYDLMGGR